MYVCTNDEKRYADTLISSKIKLVKKIQLVSWNNQYFDKNVHGSHKIILYTVIKNKK